MLEPLPAEDHLRALIVKLFLHISKDGQREHGDTRQNPLRVMLEETSTDDAPWDMIPKDDK